MRWPSRHMATPHWICHDHWLASVCTPGPGPLARDRAALRARSCHLSIRCPAPTTSTSPPPFAGLLCRAATPRPSRSIERCLAIAEKSLGPRPAFRRYRSQQPRRARVRRGAINLRQVDDQLAGIVVKHSPEKPAVPVGDRTHEPGIDGQYFDGVGFHHSRGRRRQIGGRAIDLIRQSVRS